MTNRVQFRENFDQSLANFTGYLTMSKTDQQFFKIISNVIIILKMIDNLTFNQSHF